MRHPIRDRSVYGNANTLNVQEKKKESDVISRTHQVRAR